MNTMQKESAARAAQSSYQGQYNASDWLLQEELYALLSSGRRYHCGDIQDSLGCTDSEIRAAVHDLRMKGVKVCSGRDGYWLWDGKDNTWDHTCRHVKSRLISLSRLYSRMTDLPPEGQFSFMNVESDKERNDRFREEYENDPDSM